MLHDYHGIYSGRYYPRIHIPAVGTRGYGALLFITGMSRRQGCHPLYGEQSGVKTTSCICSTDLTQKNSELCLHVLCMPGSSVDIATDYGLEDPGIESR
jgi:hypothetical protein